MRKCVVEPNIVGAQRSRILGEVSTIASTTMEVKRWSSSPLRRSTTRMKTPIQDTRTTATMTSTIVLETILITTIVAIYNGSNEENAEIL